MVFGQELIVGSVRGYQNTGDQFTKIWKNNGWNSEVDFAIYSWFKINSGFTYHDFFQGFQLTTNPDNIWSNCNILGDRVLAVYMKDSMIINGQFFVIRFMDSTLYFQIILQICDQSGPTQPKNPLDVYVTSKALPALNQSLVGITSQNLRVNIKKYQIPVNTVIDLEVSAVLQSDATPNLVQNSNNNQEFQQPQQNKHQKQDLQQEGMDLIQTSKKAQDMTLQNQFNQLALEKQVLSDNNNNNNIQLINLDQQDQQNVIQNEEKKLLLQQKQQNSKIDEINSISSEQSQQNLKLNKINNLSTKNEIGTTLKTITNIGAQSQLSLNLLQINQTIVIQNIQSQIKQQSPKISNQILDSKFQLKQEQKKEINNMNLGDIEFQNECIQNDNNNNNQTARSLQQNPQNEQIKDNQQNNQQDLQSQLKEKLNMLLKKQFLVRVLVFHEFFNIFYTFDPNMSRAIKFSIFYLRIVHSLCLTTIFDESYNINQKVMISIASSIILVTGVTIITKIHKIKFLGKKLSAFLMICLLLFYYYVILSIISGEDFQQANSKTISFLLIVSIDFLGMLTLMSILKLTIAFKTLNQVKEGGIFNIFEDVEKQEIDLLNSHLKRCEKIQSLKVNFGQSEIIMDLLRDLPFFKSLTRISFNLTNIPIQDEDFDFWILTQFLQKQKNIIELQIYLSQTKIGDSESSLLAEALSQMKKLSSLELFLDNSKISDIGVIEIIKGLKSISNNLKSLNIALNQTLISEEGIISVRAFLNNLKNLTSLILNFETTDKAAIQLVTPISGINQLQNLRLNLGGNLITDEGATHISSVLMSLKNLKALQLNLSQNQINAFGAVEIGNSLTHLQNLTSLELELWSNEIGLNGAQAIGTGLGSLNSLTNLQLYLGETKIQDEGAILLLEGIVGLKNLTKLSIVLWSNQIGNKGAQYLGNALKSLNQLKHLELNLLFSISQELIVGNLQNEFATTGQSFNKEWKNSGWNNYLGFAIYGWFKISSKQPISEWIVGFHFTSNDNSTWSNDQKYGDRVLCFFVKGNTIQIQTQTTPSSQIYQFIVQICDQNGASAAQEPLDISFISSAVPSLSQTYSQFTKQILQINLKKYQIPFNSNLDIQLNDQNPGDDIEIVELDQLELKQENQQKQNDNNQPRQNIQISKQNEEIQQLDSLNNQMSEVNLQNQDKQQTNQLLGLANTNFDINTNFNFYTSNLFPQQQSQNLNQFQINNTNMKEPSIVKLEQKQTFLVNNLDKFNHQDQQKEELQIERLDQQSNSAVSIRQDQNINRKNNNIQQQPLDQIKSVEEEQKLKEQYIIDQNLQRLFQKSFAIKVILFHDFFNIFYTYDNKMSRGIRFNIFYLRTIHSLCLTTIFDDSYTIQQKILISIISSLILVTGELIVNSAQGYLTTGKGFYKNWQGNGWDTYLDFGIYCWFKINKQYNIDNWAQGFHFTSQTNQNWQNWKQLGDRVLAFYVQGNQIQNPTYDVKSNNANIQASYSSSIYRYVDSYLYFKFIIEICNQNGVVELNDPLDISFFGFRE
ncbi:hypothetical protein ABPG73_016955 [Tetrahymena malaccensis]